MREKPRPPKAAKPQEPEYTWAESPAGQPTLVWEHAARPLWAQVLPELDLALLMEKERLEGRRVSTGAVLWQQTAQDLPDELAADGSGIILATGPSLISLDPATGAARWRQRPGGPITVLAIGADVVFVSTRGPLFALDRQTGRQRWRATCAWEPELSVYPEAGLLLVDDPETETIHALELERGTTAWEFSAEGQPVVAGPQFGGLIGISAHGAGVVAVDVATGEPRWRLQTGAAFESAGVVIGDMFVATDGKVRAVDARTGEPRWTCALQNEEDSVFTLRTLGEDLLAETWRGRLLSLDPADGSIRWERLLGQVHGITADADGLYLRAHVEEPVGRWLVAAVDRKNGDLRWELQARRQVPDVTRFGDVLVVELKNQVLVLRP